MKKIALREICELKKGRKPDMLSDQYVEGWKPYILIQSFDGSRTSFTNDAKCTECGEEDTLIVSDGARSGLSSFGHVGYIGSTIAALSPKKEKVSPKYLYYFVRSQFDLLNTHTKGATIPHLDKAYLLGMTLYLPPLPEQERIVRLLDEAESLRAARLRADERMGDFVPALFEEMFGDITINNKGWQFVSFADITEGKYGIKAGPFGSSIKKETYKSSGYKVYGQEQVIADDFTIGNYFIDERKFLELKSCEVKPGDILISLVGTFGKVSVVPDGIQQGIINPRLLKVTPNKNLIVPLFLKILLQSSAIQNQLNNFAGGMTMGVLNAGILKRLSFALPPLESQQEFASRVSEVRGIQSAQERSGERIEALYQSMLSRAFAGEL